MKKFREVYSSVRTSVTPRSEPTTPITDENRSYETSNML